MDDNGNFTPFIREIPISLLHREAIFFTSHIAPWQNLTTNITIIPEIANVSREHAGDKRYAINEKKELVEAAINRLGSFDLKLWIDGSVMKNGHGGAACVSLTPTSICNPYKRQRISYFVTLRLSTFSTVV
jgi:hypothetical protein